MMKSEDGQWRRGGFVFVSFELALVASFLLCVGVRNVFLLSFVSGFGYFNEDGCELWHICHDLEAVDDWAYG